MEHSIWSIDTTPEQTLHLGHGPKHGASAQMSSEPHLVGFHYTTSMLPGLRGSVDSMATSRMNDRTKCGPDETHRFTDAGNNSATSLAKFLPSLVSLVEYGTRVCG
ncbi:hypothetical protein GQ44DRAFT_708571 [Phaeosphaeriaceae sp. PMI808]|nr:hypothetical protein GQ44DRAFT_708571 [Phaeosphaeriaceae sp. PMI808]